MGTRFRKSKKTLPGVRLNLNKNSASISIGPKGFKQTFSTTGKKTTTVGIPGSGLSYTQTSGGHSQTAPEVCADLAPVSVKSRSVALWLCVFLGWAGVHRFYVGKAGTGILWFLTCGMFCVGWVADICKIAGCKFKDGSGCMLSRSEL